MPPEVKTPAEEAQASDTQDGGWAIESASAPPVLNPDDTTAAPIAAEGAAAAAAAPLVDDTAQGDDDDGTPAPESAASAAAGTAAGPAVAATPAQKKAKAKESAQQRIDRATFNQREAERREQAQARENADLRRRLEAIERTGTKPTPRAGEPAPSDGQPAADPMPEHPKYVDFDTEEAFQAGVAKWRTDMAGWQSRQTERLKADITKGLETRLAEDRADVERTAHEAGLAARIRAAAAKQSDFTESVEANSELLASITREQTPFIFDVIENTADGAEFYTEDLVRSPELVTALRELPLPTRALAHAVRRSPASRALMKHFATEHGRKDFMHLRQIQDPGEVFLAVGALQVSLASAGRGPVAGIHPITNAAPPAKPPAGSPRAREPEPGSNATGSFEDWMKAEDARDAAERQRLTGRPA